jgi:CHAT domain-containing protein
VTRAEMMSLTGKVAGSPERSAMPESLTAQQARLPPDLAVLAFFTGDRSTHVWMLTREELRHLRALGIAPLRIELNAFVDDLRKSRVGRNGRKLSSTLLGDLLKGVSAKRLVILADGPLNAMPFAALPTPDGNGQLVDRFVISMSPSLELALTAAKGPAMRPTRVAIVSDPVYSAADRRLSPSETAAPSRMRDSLPLARLAYSAIEAQSVSQAFAAGEGIELAGFDATPAKVLALESQPLRVLHFATHARGGEALEESALLLTRFKADGSTLSKHALTGEDISNSSLHADLVVLSGCATGLGRELRGGGVLGLTHGFLANGSRSVIASLWPIEDAPTARFMEEFYAAYRKSGRAAEALRIAQLRTRDGPPNAVWSSFVVRANELP